MRVDYVYMLFVLLMPLIPAFLLFWFLPSSSEVEGPFKGLKIKLGGAFGAYIVAVVLSWQVAVSLLQPTWSDNWNLIAHVNFDGSQAKHPSPSEALVLVHPPTAVIDSSGVLQMQVTLPVVHTSASEIPSLIISHEGYEPVSVMLDPDGHHLAAYGGEDYKVSFDKRKHEIVVNKPVFLAPQ
jgi:hypothetical protein